MGKKKGPPSIDNALPDTERERDIDPDIYNGIARCAELMGVQMIESSFNILPAFFESEDEGKLGIDVVEVSSSFDEPNRVATCIFEFENFKKKGRRKVFTVKDKFIVFYHIPADCDEFHAVAFARRVGVIACYPYFRSHVATTASLANAEMPILPTLAKMPVRQKEVKKEKSDE
jgi:hypothetical protein